MRITEVRDNIFYAELILDQPQVSARVSDAIALALHLGVPIHAEDIVLDTAAVANTAIRAEGDDRAPDEVEQFRRFLDTASPEDFDPDSSLAFQPVRRWQSMITNRRRMRSSTGWATGLVRRAPNFSDWRSTRIIQRESEGTCLEIDGSSPRSSRMKP